MLNADITNGQGNTYYVATVGSDNDLGHGGVNGKHPDTPFLTIDKGTFKVLHLVIQLCLHLVNFKRHFQ